MDMWNFQTRRGCSEEFGFRKHEQGNNAVEIPQFDPLVEAAEKKIALLKQPRSHRFELVRQK